MPGGESFLPARGSIPCGDARFFVAYKLSVSEKKESEPMNEQTRKPRFPVLTLVETALCIALAAVLSELTLFKMPLGGSVTPFATLPVILIGLRHGAKWGVSAALLFSLTQTMFGLDSVMALRPEEGLALTAADVGRMALCVLLDYVLAYTLLGFTGSLARKFSKAVPGLTVAILATGLGRFLCSFLSGVLIWDVYTPEGWNVAAWSLAYNGTWCAPDVGITLAVALLLAQVPVLGLFPKRTAAAA
jgi:thiamine transporter